MCFGRVCEGHLFANDRPKRTVLESSDNSGMYARNFRRRSVRDRHAKYRCIADHGCARIDFDSAPASNDNDSSKSGEQIKVLAQIDIGQQFDDHIDALSIGELADLIKVRWIMMIEHVMGSVLEDRLPPL